MDINTHGLSIGFGKHSGTLWTRLPISYLKWMSEIRLDRLCKLPSGEEVRAEQIADTELMRRGVTFNGDVEISIHAINRVSQKYLDLFIKTRKNNEGIMSWIEGHATAAIHGYGLFRGQPEVTIEQAGMKFVFEMTTVTPLVKTVK